MMKKSIFLILAFFLSSSLLLSQSLVEAAKKEKERRAQLKKTSTIVVMNANLGKKAGGEINRTVTAEDPSRKIQVTESQPRPIPKKAAASQQTENLDQMQARGYEGDFATRILNSSEHVINPELALNKPDGKYAKMPIMGFIDLEIDAKNGPGDDIAIFALHSGTQEEMPSGEEEGGIPELTLVYEYLEGFWYGILGMKEQGDWVAIGKGSGTNSPEKFDLGDLPSVKKVRLVFKPLSNADLPFKLETWQASEFFFRIDAVESLHK